MLPGHGGDRAGPAPVPAGAPRLPDRDGHRRSEEGPDSLRPPQPQDRVLPGEVRGPSVHTVLAPASVCVRPWDQHCPGRALPQRRCQGGREGALGRQAACQVTLVPGLSTSGPSPGGQAGQPPASGAEQPTGSAVFPSGTCRVSFNMVVLWGGNGVWALTSSVRWATPRLPEDSGFHGADTRNPQQALHAGLGKLLTFRCEILKIIAAVCACVMGTREQAV